MSDKRENRKITKNVEQGKVNNSGSDKGKTPRPSKVVGSRVLYDGVVGRINRPIRDGVIS